MPKELKFNIKIVIDGQGTCSFVKHMNALQNYK